MKIFEARANGDQWKSISCIQTNVKSDIGCGFPYIIHFYANINGELTQETKIDYDFQSLGEDIDLIRTD
jgi:hypothetical protein